MEKIFKENEHTIEKIQLIYSSLVLVFLLVSQILYTYSLNKMDRISIELSILGLFGLIIYIYYKIKFKIKFDIFDLMFLLLTVFGIISSIFSINFSVSIFGFKGRYEGLFAILTYYVLFLNSRCIKSKKYKEIILNIILILGIFQAIYSVLQYFGVRNIFGLKVIRKRYYSSGFEVNPNFLGTIIIINISISLVLYFLKNNVFLNIYYGIISVIYFQGMLASGTMSAAVAFIIFLILLFVILLIYRQKFLFILIKFTLVFIAFVFSYCKFNKIDNSYFFGQVKKTAHEINNTVQGNAKDSYGTGRIHIWRETIKILPNNLITGVGIDNFYYGFGEKHLIDIKSGLYVDKAHNEYLQKLVTEGIFSFICYIGLLVIIFITSIKRLFKDKNNYILTALFFCFLSYLIQALFNISIITVAPTFYIIMGLLVSEIKKDKLNEEN